MTPAEQAIREHLAIHTTYCKNLSDNTIHMIVRRFRNDPDNAPDDWYETATRDFKTPAADKKWLRKTGLELAELVAANPD